MKIGVWKRAPKADDGVYIVFRKIKHVKSFFCPILDKYGVEAILYLLCLEFTVGSKFYEI